MAEFELIPQAVSKLEEWKKLPEAKILIGVDIGATNTRIGVALTPVDYETLALFECERTSKLLAGFSAVGEKLQKLIAGSKATVVAACIDAAGPIGDQGKRVTITNWPDEADRVILLSALPASLFPAGHTALINDLEAACHGILGLNQANQLGSCFESFFDKTNPGLCSEKHYLVLAMGTGLGVGVLISGRNGFTVLPVEIGHTLVTSFGAEYPDASHDCNLMAFLSKKIYNGAHMAEFEDICSGRGLKWAYEWATLSFSEEERVKALKMEPKDIAMKALAGDAAATDAMYLHYKFLFRVAQNCCVGLQTKGVIMAGDNQVNNGPFVATKKTEYQREFNWHPKQMGKDKWLDNVPVFVQNRKVNTNMIGALKVASSL